MKIIAISQRVTKVMDYCETRDSLDQAWTLFLSHCGYIPLIIPNTLSKENLFQLLATVKISGVILTGGNSMVGLPENSPERDSTEKILLNYSIENNIPVIGVCRGMQFIGVYFGANITPIENHVSVDHIIYKNATKRVVNSFHDYTLCELPSALIAEYVDENGSVEAFSHTDRPIYGMMWHPERNQPFHEDDIKQFKKQLG